MKLRTRGRFVTVIGDRPEGMDASRQIEVGHHLDGEIIVAIAETAGVFVVEPGNRVIVREMARGSREQLVLVDDLHGGVGVHDSRVGRRHCQLIFGAGE